MFNRHAAMSAELIEGLSLRARLMEEFRVEIGDGLGELKGKVIRIGLMGNGASSGPVC
ncbi:hypothetical protein [Vibrio cincinnatiensis]|uniref:hypothetical protein n=1 Tax=Vibrio cincinnatiensis TaxID=675 RepID=UPI001EDE817D|nr:hypothetical protein [Vibrio cincinnatiensis]